GAAPCFQTASSIRRLLPCSVTVNVRSVCRFVHKHVVCLTVLSGLLCGDHSAYAIWAARGLQSRNRADERAVTPPEEDAFRRCGCYEVSPPARRSTRTRRRRTGRTTASSRCPTCRARWACPGASRILSCAG